MARAEDRVFGKREDSAEALPGVLPRECGAAHGTCEEGVAGEGERALESGDDKRGAAGGVSRCGDGADFERADEECRIIGKRGCGGEGFAGADMHDGAVFFEELFQAGDVVAVDVGEEDLPDVRSQCEHFGAFRSGVERGGLAGGGIDDEVAVHEHVAEACGKMMEAGDGGDGCRVPSPAGTRQQGVGAEVQFGGEFLDVRFVGGERSGRQTEAATRFPDDVLEFVLEGNGVRVAHGAGYFCVSLVASQGRRVPD